MLPHILLIIGIGIAALMMLRLMGAERERLISAIPRPPAPLPSAEPAKTAVPAPKPSPAPAPPPARAPRS